MVKCKFNNKKFTVNDRCTICTLTGEIKWPALIFDEGIYWWIKHHPVVRADFHNGSIFFSVIGKALQSPMDEPDEVTGRRIAECRAKIRAYKFCTTLCSKMDRLLKEHTKQFSDGICTFESYYGKELLHESNLLSSK